MSYYIILYCITLHYIISYHIVLYVVILYKPPAHSPTRPLTRNQAPCPRTESSPANNVIVQLLDQHSLLYDAIV